MLHRYNKTAGAKRGLVETSAYEALLPYVAKPDESPRYALHFGKVNKVGVNPRSEWETPLAVCAFPLTEEVFDEFLGIRLPFAQTTSKYLYLLEIQPEARVFYSTPRFFDQGIGPEYVGNPEDSSEFFYSTRPEGYKDSPQYFSEEHQTVARAAKWGRSLMEMGISVWVDADDEGILHENEPSQVMFFNPRSYSIVLSMDNPKNSLEVRFGRDWRRRKDVRGADLRRAKLTGVDLSGVDLSGAYLNGADLTRAYLKDVKYDDKTIWPKSVRDVLRVWRGDKNLRFADLRFANLRRADLRFAQLIGASLFDAKLNGAELHDAKLIRAGLQYADLTGADLKGADLTDAYLHRAILTDADLTGADLRGAELTHAYLKNVKYDDKTVWPEYVRDVLRVWRGDKDLTSANLYEAKLREADLRDAKLTGAKLNDADLSGADLTGAILRRADLNFAILTGAKLNDADLRGADLTFAILTGTKLNDADLTGITYDNKTTWPEDFTPPPSTPRPKRRR